MVALLIALLTGLTVSAWILLSPEVKWEVWSESVSHSVVSDSLRPHSPPGSSVRGILQARILEWVAMPSPPGDLPNPGIELGSPALHTDSLPSEPSGKPQWPHFWNNPTWMSFAEYTSALLSWLPQNWFAFPACVQYFDSWQIPCVGQGLWVWLCHLLWLLNKLLLPDRLSHVRKNHFTSGLWFPSQNSHCMAGY